jgi:hypothetical protein
MMDETIHFAISSSRVCLKDFLRVLLLHRHNSFRPWSLMLLLHSGCIWRLFSNVGPLGAPRTTLSWAHLFNGFQYTMATCWNPDQSSSALIVSTTVAS